MLSASDLEGMYGIIATPANEGADRWDAVDTVNLAETERLTDKLIADGVNGLIVLGTTGECATVTEDEYRDFVDCFLSTVNGRVPTFVGATTLGTHQTIERLRFASERGADGTLLGLPMWQPCTDEMAIRFYESVGEAFPDLAIMVYMNERAFRFDFSNEFWAELVERVPTAVCAKFGRPDRYLELLDITKRRVNFLPMDMMAFPTASISQPDVTACWTTAAGMGPQPSVALMDAIRANDMDRAKLTSEEITGACEVLFTPEVMAEFGHYNIQLEKLRIQAAGYSDPGPIRPPYDVVPDEWAENARECGRRWAELVEKYSS